jgi:hypothetical protein
MKRLLGFITVVIVLTTTGFASAAETAAKPEECIRNFYRWYVTNLVANSDPMKQHNEIRRHGTERLLNEIAKMVKGPDGLDGDYFVDAQDFDPLWAKNIAISPAHINGDRCTATVVLNGAKGMRKKLDVELAKENGTWKVEKVRGRDTPR